MRITDIAFVCYPVTDLARARRFYEGTLGLSVSQVFGDDKTAWIEYGIGSGTLSIGNGAPEWKASAGGGSAGLEVDDLDAFVAKCAADGAPMMPVMESPVCRMAVVSDPDGNSVTLHQRRSK